MATVRLVQMRSKIERGVSWTDGANVRLHEDGSRTSRMTLSRERETDPMTIDARITTEELQQSN